MGSCVSSTAFAAFLKSASASSTSPGTRARTSARLAMVAVDGTESLSRRSFMDASRRRNSWRALRTWRRAALPCAGANAFASLPGVSFTVRMTVDEAAFASNPCFRWLVDSGEGVRSSCASVPRVERGYVISVIRFRPRIPRIPQASLEASRFREATWLLAGCSQHVQRSVCDVALAARRASSHVRQ